MTTEIDEKRQIYQIIDTLPMEKLPDLLRLLKQFLHLSKSETSVDAAPIYQLHRDAVDTDVPDLAAQHDHYLYGVNKQDV